MIFRQTPPRAPDQLTRSYAVAEQLSKFSKPLTNR